MFKEARGFSDDGFETPATELPAILRNHAKRTGMVTALGDLDIRHVARRGEDARREVVIEVWLGRSAIRPDAVDQAHDLVEFIGADQCIHFRHVLLDVAAIAFHQAAGHDQLFCAAGFLKLGHFKNGLDRFLLGGIDEAAGVDDNHVGSRRVGRQFMSAGDKLAHHDLGIDEVLGATQADKSYLHY